MEGRPGAGDAPAMDESVRHHSIRVVSSSETTGEGWLRLHAWMREWAGHTELHLVHIETVDLLGLQSLLERLEYALGRGATALTVDLGSVRITAAAMVALIAERERLSNQGIKVVIRGRANLRGATAGEAEATRRRPVPSGRSPRGESPVSRSPSTDSRRRERALRTQRVRLIQH